MQLIDPLLAELLQKIKLPVQFIRLQEGVLRVAINLDADLWRRSKMTDEEAFALQGYRRAKAWSSIRYPVSQTQEQMYLADLEVTTEVELAIEKEALRDLSLERAWGELRQLLYDGKVAGFVFGLDGRSDPVESDCWLNPYLGREFLNSIRTSLVVLRANDGRTLRGLGAFRAEAFEGDFLTRWKQAQSAPLVEVRPAAPTDSKDQAMAMAPENRISFTNLLPKSALGDSQGAAATESSSRRKLARSVEAIIKRAITEWKVNGASLSTRPTSDEMIALVKCERPNESRATIRDAFRAEQKNHPEINWSKRGPRPVE